MTTMYLLDLPEEILERIIDNVNLPCHLLQLPLTCKRFANLITPH